jgi:DNA-binding NarL/FixJ family response regulator
MLHRALERGALDLAVTAYRANPGVLSVLLSSARLRDETLFVVRRASDEGLLEALGLSTAAIVDPSATLSAREREVRALAREGLTNAQIGRNLFIAESTVKAHLHRIYEKLGVHSRTALMLDSSRRSYATPTDADERGANGLAGGSASDPNPEPRA